MRKCPTQVRRRRSKQNPAPLALHTRTYYSLFRASLAVEVDWFISQCRRTPSTDGRDRDVKMRMYRPEWIVAVSQPHVGCGDRAHRTTQLYGDRHTYRNVIGCFGDAAGRKGTSSSPPQRPTPTPSVNSQPIEPNRRRARVRTLAWSHDLSQRWSRYVCWAAGPCRNERGHGLGSTSKSLDADWWTRRTTDSRGWIPLEVPQTYAVYARRF